MKLLVASSFSFLRKGFCATEVRGSFLLKPFIALTFPHLEKSLAGKAFWGVLAESWRIEIEIFSEILILGASIAPACPPLGDGS